MRPGVPGKTTVVARVYLTTLWLEVVSLMEAKTENACMLRIDEHSGKIGHQLFDGSAEDK